MPSAILGSAAAKLLPDFDGGVRQDLAVAVPAAVGGGAAAGRVVAADLTEQTLPVLPQVQLQVRVALAVTRREAETPHAVNVDEGQVELRRRRRDEDGQEAEGRKAWRRQEARRTWSSLLVWRSRWRRKSRREHFLTRMRSVVPSARWAAGDRPLGLRGHAQLILAAFIARNFPRTVRHSPSHSAQTHELRSDWSFTHKDSN